MLSSPMSTRLAWETQTNTTDALSIWEGIRFCTLNLKLCSGMWSGLFGHQRTVRSSKKALIREELKSNKWWVESRRWLGAILGIWHVQTWKERCGLMPTEKSSQRRQKEYEPSPSLWHPSSPKAQLEERSPRVDVVDAGWTVSQGPFHSECSRNYFQHKEEKPCSVPSRYQCEKQMGWASHRGGNYNPNQDAYTGHWMLMFIIYWTLAPCVLCSILNTGNLENKYQSKIPLINQI